ncbi:hypothetical protein HDU80_006973 [Chytriomyces hyalinus]|nr:hypothetical protein HDU80_006973 [Chytriomyces hyalinus]
MEQTSRPMEIHVSAPTYDLIKDVFEFEVSESVPILDGKQRMGAWWLLHKKSRNGSNLRLGYGGGADAGAGGGGGARNMVQNPPRSN